MGLRAVSVALLLGLGGVSLASAQGARDLGPPANLPPSGFKGQQYVDARGCVYLKAGLGGQTSWVPRVDRNHKPLCGFPPTFGPAPRIEMAEAAPAAKPAPAAAPAAAKPAPAPVVVAAPAQLKPVAPVPVVVPVVAPAPAAKPAPGYQVASGGGVPAGKIGCYRSAPVAERVRLQGGGTAMVCTRGDGTLDGWRPPIYPDDAPVGAALGLRPGETVTGTARDGATRVASETSVVAAAEVEVEAVPTPPKGYVVAWKDDRLNPKRGVGTAEGWAEQDQVWTRKVPAKLASDTPKKKRKPLAETSVTVSTKSAPSTAPAPKGAGAVYVQVGSFGVPSNAEGAAARLRAAGLPVAMSRLSSKGKALQVVLAGPFDGGQAQAALGAVRRAGFGDAFLR